MWVFANPNPCNILVEDCVIRDISIAQEKNWKDTHKKLCDLSREVCNIPSANSVWGTYLIDSGARYYEVYKPITVRQFCILHPYGAYVIGTGNHAVTIIDGDWYDVWDSGDEYISYYFKIK